MKMESQNLHILGQFTYSQSLKVATQLFLSVSMFSFFFSHSSFLPFLPSLKHFILSTIPYQLFTHTLDKNFMFLICNGLLVFLAKYSGRSLPLSCHQDESSSNNFIESSQPELSMQLNKLELPIEPESIGLEENVAMQEGNEKEYYFTNQRETEKEIVEDKEQQEKEGQEEVEEEEEEEEEEENSFEHVAEQEDENNWMKEDILVEQEEEEEEDDDDDDDEVGNGEMSTEELNKKFDEFIRRMKEELRIEAQRQLIMV